MRLCESASSEKFNSLSNPLASVCQCEPDSYYMPLFDDFDLRNFESKMNVVILLAQASTLRIPSDKTCKEDHRNTKNEDWFFLNVVGL